jgi:hypothetical protein
LAEPQATETFAAACAAWLAAGAASGATARIGGDCEGRDGTVRFSAHFVEEPETALSIVLDTVPDP